MDIIDYLLENYCIEFTEVLIMLFDERIIDWANQVGLIKTIGQTTYLIIH
jgi:hypothetical protein